MNDWFSYWNEQPRMRDPDPLRQVGKTVNGVPIGAEQFEAIVHDARQKLALRAGDVLLDLCCGNGLLTRELAKQCAQVVGVDFSLPLIQSAQQRFAAANIEYVVADICKLPSNVMQRTYSKVCMYEGLQHLNPGQARLVLLALAELPGPQPLLLLGSVPDKDRIWDFYDTPQRRAEYERRQRDGTEPIGHWWDRKELSELLQASGYEPEFLPQNPLSHGARYRVDVLCRPSPAR